MKDKVALRLGRKRSYSSGLELPDGGGDASGVSGKILLYVRQAGGTQRASLFLLLPDSEKYQDLLSNPLSLLKKKIPLPLLEFLSHSKFASTSKAVAYTELT